MIRHIVFFKLADPSPEIVGRTLEILRGMRGKVEGMLELEAGANFLESERNYDISLMCLFSDRQSFDAYQTHPAHLPVKAHMHAVRIDSKACDYEI